MPKEVKQRVSKIGQQQGMPKTLTFGDCHAREIIDTIENVDPGDGNSLYTPGLDNPNDDTTFEYDSEPDDESNHNNDKSLTDSDDNDNDDMSLPGNGPPKDHRSEDGLLSDDSTNSSVDPDDTERDAQSSASGSQSGKGTGVEPGSPSITGVGDNSQLEGSVDNTTEYDRYKLAIRAGEDSAAHGTDLPKRKPKPNRHSDYEYVHNILHDINPEVMFTLMMEDESYMEQMFSFLTAQMSAK